MRRRATSPAAAPRLSQHFLHSPVLARQLVDAAGISPGEHVLDIGAGLGILTLALARRGAQVTAVEVDASLAGRLQSRTAKLSTVRVHHGDVLRMPLPAAPFSVVANLPFHHTTAILRRLLDDPCLPLQKAALIVEWGYACGMTSPHDPTREAIGWAPWYALSLIRHLRPAVFDPPPRVSAAVVSIMRRPEPLIPVEHAARYRALLREMFRAGHLPLKNLLCGRLSPRRWTRLCTDLAVPHGGRAGDLDVWQWAAVYRALANLDAGASG